MVQSRVRFVIIGGVAMRMHGSSHVTDDIDFSYARDLEGLPGLVEILNRYHVRLRDFPANLPFFFDCACLLEHVDNLDILEKLCPDEGSITRFISVSHLSAAGKQQFHTVPILPPDGF